MNNKSIHDLHHLLVKAHFQTPDRSPLPKSKQEILNRARAAARILDKNPVRKNAVALLRALYPNISRATAFRDLILAESLFPSVRTFNYDLWNTFLLNSIFETLQRCKAINTVAAHKLMVREHANLLKVIGKRPEEQPDPNRDEPHQYIFYLQGMKSMDTMDAKAMADVPVTSMKELKKWDAQIKRDRKKLEKNMRQQREQKK